MSAQQPRSTRWLSHRRGALEMRRRVIATRGAWAHIEQRFEGSAPFAVLATGASAFISSVVVRRGELSFRDSNGESAAPSSSFVLYLPPHSLVRMPVADAIVETIGWASTTGFSSAWPNEPLAVPMTASEHGAHDLEALLDVVRTHHAGHHISADGGCSARLVRARGTLSRAAFSRAPVGRVALAEGYDAAVFSRTFVQAYGITPAAYCGRIRVHDAVVALFSGISIARASFTSGFRDLSRFYRQFRKTTGTTPGAYRSDQAIKKRQDAR